jgi:hypothetical protein
MALMALIEKRGQGSKKDVKKVIEEIEKKQKKISYGPRNKTGFIDQGFVVMKNDYILDFIQKYLSVPGGESMASGMIPERKFEIVNRKDNMFCPLPFGYGKGRPVDFKQDMFYVEQIESSELDSITNLIRSL